jgi:diacylglycerol kinase (ATP)
MSERIVAIVNPRSKLGATGKRLDGVRRELDRALASAAYTLTLTEGPFHASSIAQKAIAEGASRIVACGGDGTISEVVEGIMTSGAPSRVALSVLPHGTGSDFVRSLNAYAPSARQSRAPDGGPNELRIDVARVEFQTESGEPSVRHMLNVASVGLSAEAVRWVDAQGRNGKRHRFSYLFSAFVGFARYQVAEVELRVDGSSLYRGPLQTAAIANGSFFGGGMPVAPEACLDDGLLDVVCITPPRQAWRVLPLFLAFLRGKHLEHELTHAARGHEVVLTSPSKVWLEIDGEPAGMLPARIEVLPARLRVRTL